MSAPQPALSRCGRTRRLRPARRICGSPGLPGNCLCRVPWFHENALLQVDGRDDDLADDGAGCTAGEERERSDLSRNNPRRNRAGLVISAEVDGLTVPAAAQKQGGLESPTAALGAGEAVDPQVANLRERDDQGETPALLSAWNSSGKSTVARRSGPRQPLRTGTPPMSLSFSAGLNVRSLIN